MRQENATAEDEDRTKRLVLSGDGEPMMEAEVTQAGIMGKKTLAVSPHWEKYGAKSQRKIRDIVRGAEVERSLCYSLVS